LNLCMFHDEYPTRTWDIARDMELPPVVLNGGLALQTRCVTAADQ
jgi:hypothetical protein